MPFYGDNEKADFSYSIAFHPAIDNEKQGTRCCFVSTGFGYPVGHSDLRFLCTDLL